MSEKMRWFTDERDPENLITEDQLKRKYAQSIVDGSIDPAERTFGDYLAGYMASNGGPLTELQPQQEIKSTFTFMIRETLTMEVKVDALTYEEAQDAVQELYHDGVYNLDHNCFAGVEFCPCCSCCGSDFDFDDTDHLRTVNDNTPHAMLLCERCVANMEDAGFLTRCDACGNLFSPARLEVNPVNGIKEICPDCGEVWCE